MDDGALIGFAESLASLSGPAVVALVLWLLVRGILITRNHYDTMVSDRDTWQRLALDAIALGEQAVKDRMAGEHSS